MRTNTSWARARAQGPAPPRGGRGGPERTGSPARRPDRNHIAQVGEASADAGGELHVVGVAVPAGDDQAAGLGEPEDILQLVGPVRRVDQGRADPQAGGPEHDGAELGPVGELHPKTVPGLVAEACEGRCKGLRSVPQGAPGGDVVPVVDDGGGRRVCVRPFGEEVPEGLLRPRPRPEVPINLPPCEDRVLSPDELLRARPHPCHSVLGRGHGPPPGKGRGARAPLGRPRWSFVRLGGRPPGPRRPGSGR